MKNIIEFLKRICKKSKKKAVLERVKKVKKFKKVKNGKKHR